MLRPSSVISLSAESSVDRWGGIGSALALIRGAGLGHSRLIELVPGDEDAILGLGRASIAVAGLGVCSPRVYSCDDRRNLRLVWPRGSAEFVRGIATCPQLLLVHNEELVSVGHCVARLLGIPVVYCSHSDLTMESDDTWAKEVQEAATDLADAVVAFSPTHVRHLALRWRVSAHLLHLPLADLDVRRPALDISQRPTVNAAPLLFAAGRAVYQKGFDVLIEAVRGIDGDCALEVALGRGSDSLMRALCEMARLDHRITIRPWLARAELDRSIAAADLVIVPSRYEPLGLFAAQAALAGRNLLVTDVCGLASLVETATAKSDDVSALRAAALDALRRPPEAPKRALRAYTATRFRAQWSKLSGDIRGC